MHGPCAFYPYNQDGILGVYYSVMRMVFFIFSLYVRSSHDIDVYMCEGIPNPLDWLVGRLEELIVFGLKHLLRFTRI